VLSEGLQCGGSLFHDNIKFYEKGEEEARGGSGLASVRLTGILKEHEAQVGKAGEGPPQRLCT
jgi:hypothetical protein